MSEVQMEKAAESFASANKSLRDVIRLGEDEIGRLESFETGFNDMMEKFSQFSDSAFKHDKLSHDLQTRLQQDLKNLHRTIDNLKSEIVHLKQSNEEQSLENNKLERDLEESVEKFQRFQSNINHNMGGLKEPFPGLGTSTPNYSIDRYYDDCN